MWYRRPGGGQGQFPTSANAGLDAFLPREKLGAGTRDAASTIRMNAASSSRVDGCQNPRKDGAAKKVGMALAFISAAPCSRTLGGKRWLGDKPCQGRQPPEAGAAGPPLQGLPPSHTRPPRSTADPRDAASSAIYARIHAAGNIPGSANELASLA